MYAEYSRADATSASSGCAGLIGIESGMMSHSEQVVSAPIWSQAASTPTRPLSALTVYNNNIISGDLASVRAHSEEPPPAMLACQIAA